MSPRKARPTKSAQKKNLQEKNGSETKPSDKSNREPSMQRINKVLAAAGLGSRRQVDELIEQGRVEIDGQVITQVGVKVDLTSASISVDGQLLKQHRPVYYALHKPEGVLCTNRDPQGRPRVIDFVPNQHRLFPVGRLDASSTGLILLTNDGELAQQLAHPKHEIPKRYAVVVVGQVELDALKRLERGIYLAEGKAQVDQARLKKVRKTSTDLEITLSEGKNREIRRVLARLGHKVVSLKRIAIGPLKLADLPEGAYRALSVHEVQGLYQAVDDIRRERKAARKARKKLASSSQETESSTQETPRSNASKLPKPPKARGKNWETLPSLAQNPYATDEDIDQSTSDEQDQELILIRDHGPAGPTDDFDDQEYFFVPKKRSGSVIGQEDDQETLDQTPGGFEFEPIELDDDESFTDNHGKKPRTMGARNLRANDRQKNGGQKNYGQKNGGQKNGGQKNGGQKNDRQKNGGQKNDRQKNGGQKNGGQINGDRRSPRDSDTLGRDSQGAQRGGTKRGGPKGFGPKTPSSKRSGPKRGGPKRGGSNRSGPNRGGRSGRGSAR